MTGRTVVAIVAVLLVGAVALTWMSARGGAPGRVVVYTSVDEEFAKPLFEKFERETGLKVEPRFDSESVKTTGMAQRLLQMKGRPDGDVFWNSEQSFSQVLANEEALEPYDSPSAKDIPAHFKDPQQRWTGFGCRARVLVYNTNRVKREELPKTLEDLAQPRWKGRFLVAKPLFGTTRSHLVSLVLAVGEEKAFALFRAWRENGVVIAASNGDVRNRVADENSGFDIGLTDTDDVFSAMERNKPVDFVVLSQTADWSGAYLIPNTVAQLKGAPNQAGARAFIDYLLRPETEVWLANNGARQIPVRPVQTNLPPSLQNLEPAKVDVNALAQNVLPLGERIYRFLSGEEK